ncbi:protein SseB [Leptospira broomii serovar Hurstbridge str. 5399]|uniref:Protein SseB n=1 Tax=Leptospira broomii serovar Hurstbridge str. 5399 TaxID=1049789 RepID=T0F7T1_9LEPT|nr:enhanced serine sensitivity protein SseB C-terminal domain-containing protein [Leptospira broomii]EQA43966.1 protein SseB [Leptospira broomii serovar Hurstbridge str. 5399]
MLSHPENPLELALSKAATEPAYRPEFYRLLLESQLFVLGESDIEPDANGVLQSEASIQLINITFENEYYIPIFSSLRRLEEYISGKESYLNFEAKAFFQFTKGSQFFLNPGSDYGKILKAGEIEGLLNGSLWRPNERIEVKEETEIFLGQPSDYPHKLVDSLKLIFKEKKEVKRAYLARIFNPSSGDPGHILIGIEISNEADWDEVMKDTGFVAKEAMEGLIDFVRVNPLEKSSNSVSSYLINDTKPFFKRGFFG